jgi:hypothetical protein
MRTRIPGWAVIVTILGAPFALVVFLANTSRNPNRQPNASPSLSVGSDAQIGRADGGPNPRFFLVAIDSESMEVYTKALIAKGLTDD